MLGSWQDAWLIAIYDRSLIGFQLTQIYENIAYEH